jgi:rhomboid family GlyGly-CTERM serine protease
MNGISWRKSLNCDGAYGWALLLVLAVVLLPAAGGARWLLALRFERSAVQHGEWWRLLSAHCVHLGVRHLLLDGAALVLLWALYARALDPKSWLLVLLGSIVAIDAGLWWLAPRLQWYVGISGLLHGVWAAGAVTSAWRRDITGWLLMFALAGKLAWEQLAGASLVVASFPVVVDAHLYGALGGLLALAAMNMLPRRL